MGVSSSCLGGECGFITSRLEKEGSVMHRDFDHTPVISTQTLIRLKKCGEGSEASGIGRGKKAPNIRWLLVNIPT